MSRVKEAQGWAGPEMSLKYNFQRVLKMESVERVTGTAGCTGGGGSAVVFIRGGERTTFCGHAMPVAVGKKEADISTSWREYS